MRSWKKQLRIGVRQLACICQPAAWELQNIFFDRNFLKDISAALLSRYSTNVCRSNWINQTFHSYVRTQIHILLFGLIQIKFWQLPYLTMFAKIQFMTQKVSKIIDDVFQICTCFTGEQHFVIHSWEYFLKFDHDVNVNHQT